MTIEASIDALAVQTSALLETCVAMKAGVSQQISDAVAVSTNAAIIPLMSMATNLIDTQTMVMRLISTR